jgi:hypothetical protein
LIHRFRVTVSCFAWLLAVVLACVSLAEDARADDQKTLAGSWAAGPLTVKWIIGDWGPACGPKPSGGGEGVASVQITQSGSELTLSGGGRTYSTTECWELYPGIQRVSHVATGRSWKNVCKTAPGDPRQATLQTSLSATDSSLSFYEAGQYQFVIQGQNCTASVGRYRTYALVQRAGEPDSPPPQASAAKVSPPAPTATSDRCASPGAPARLEVRPARKLLRAGDVFEFRTLVYDAAGCPLGAKPTWAVEAGGEHIEITTPGTIHVKPDAPEGEARLTASVGGRSALVTVEVASSERYDALLRSGAFNAAGEVDEAASVAIASQSIGAASVVAEDRARERKKVFVAVVGAVALGLGALALVLVGRTRRVAREQAAQEAVRRARAKAMQAAPPRAPDPAPPRAAPEAPVPEPVPPTAPVAARPARTICPVCGTQYAPESRFCGKDGATLLPLNQ